MSKTHFLKSLNLRSLSALEVYQLSKNLLDDLRDQGLSISDDSHLSTLTESLRELTGLLRVSLEADKSNAINEQFYQTEQLRKEDFRALINGVRIYRKATRSNDKEAYQLLVNPLEERKEVLTCYYEKASAHLSVLLTNFEKENYQAALTTLHLSHLVDYLRESHQSFEKISQDYQDYKAKLPKQTPSEAKSLTINAYQLLVDYIILHHRLNVSPLYSNYLELINQGRMTFSLSQKHKKGAKALKINSSDENMPA